MDTLPSRRQVLVGSTSLIVANVLTGRAHAVEPITVLTAVATIFSIIKGAIEFSKGPLGRDPILNQIDTKLDVVIRNQERILKEIIELRFYLDEAVANGFKNHDIAELNDQKTLYDILVADKTANSSEYLTLLQRVEALTIRVGGYDIAAFVSFGAGVGLALTLYSRLSKPQRSTEAKKKFIEILDGWLDPAKPKSVASLMTSTQNEINSRRQALDARPRSFVLGVSYTSKKVAQHFEKCEVADTLFVVGDFDTGYSPRREPVVSGCTVEQGGEPGDCRGRACLMTEIDQSNAAVAKKLASLPLPKSLLNTVTTVSLPIRPVPEFTPSPYAPVNSFNLERIAIIELYNVLARQDYIREQMEATRDVLKRSL
jgi:hypothetical protein